MTNFGILGTGQIAKKFADAAEYVKGARVCAVGSRSAETAGEFGSAHGIPAQNRFSSYEELAACADVDVVYVATPHGYHYEHMLLALRHGKHVLCEKSFTLNRAQAAKVFEEAAARGLFVMEAMWTRFLPSNRLLMQKLEDGVIGALQGGFAAFGGDWGADIDLSHRLADPEKGGGGLLDMGVYPISFLSMAVNDAEFESVTAAGRIFEPTGVDAQCAVSVCYPGNLMWTAVSAMRCRTPDDAYISGEKGIIRAPRFWNPTVFTVSADGRDETFETPQQMAGLSYEIEEVVSALSRGETESKIMPRAATLRVMDIMDRARTTLGVRYPAER